MEARAFVPEYPIATTNGVPHLFIDFKLSDYFELMIPNDDSQPDCRDYNYDSSPMYDINDDERFCMCINKNNGSAYGWINYTGCCVDKCWISVVLRNEIRPLFKSQDEFLAFVEYIEPSIVQSFRENEWNEDTADETIVNTVLIQHIPILITSLNPLKYQLNAIYEYRPIGEDQDRDPIYRYEHKLHKIPMAI